MYLEMNDIIVVTFITKPIQQIGSIKYHILIYKAKAKKSKSGNNLIWIKDHSYIYLYFLIMLINYIEIIL